MGSKLPLPEKMATYRDQIDKINLDMLTSLQQRSNLVSKIYQVKKECGMDLIDSERESKMLKSIVEQNSDSCIPDEQVALFFRGIFQISQELFATFEKKIHSE